MIELIKDSPEVHSLEESLAILDSYRDKISPSSYACLFSTIHNFAIENMFLNASDISANLAVIEDGRDAKEVLKDLSIVVTGDHGDQSQQDRSR